jgi:hypothetical protein
MIAKLVFIGDYSAADLGMLHLIGHTQKNRHERQTHAAYPKS